MIEMHYSITLGATIFRAMGRGGVQAEILRVPDSLCVLSPRIQTLLSELQDASFAHRRPGSRYIETVIPKNQRLFNELMEVARTESGAA